MSTNGQNLPPIFDHVHIQDPLGYIQDALGYIQDALGYIQDNLGYIQTV